MDLTALNNLTTAISSFLSSLGPWGVVAGIAVAILYQWYRIRSAAAPLIPTATPSAATTPLALAPIAPLLSALLPAIGVATGTTKTPLTTAHVSHGLLTQLSNEVDAVTAAKVGEHTAALADLAPTPPTTPVTPAVGVTPAKT